MGVIYIILLILTIYGISVKMHGFIDQPFDRRVKHSINGMFIILVFCRHIFQYISPSFHTVPYLIDKAGSIIDGHLFQLLVVSFLFFSGYGLTISAERRGGCKQIPIHRCLTVLLNFMIAVCLFAVLQLTIGSKFSLKEFLLSLICWDSLGNSNWYIFCILWCYMFSYISYKLSSSKATFIVIVWLLSITYILTLYKFKGSYWYDTVLAYPTGVTFTVYRKRIMWILKERWLQIFALIMVLFGVSYYVLLRHPNALVHNATSIMLCLMMIIIMMKVRIQNRYLEWMGKNLFPLYIYADTNDSI